MNPNRHACTARMQPFGSCTAGTWPRVGDCSSQRAVGVRPRPAVRASLFIFLNARCYELTMHQSRMKRGCSWHVLLASTLFLACGANVAQCVRSLDGMNHTIISGTKRDHSIVGYVLKLENNSFAFSAAASEGSNARTRPREARSSCFSSD